MDDPDKPYRRILLKLSGEILRGEQTQAAFGADAVARIAGGRRQRPVLGKLGNPGGQLDR